ncbi:hypothetical protein BO83DRAFT_80335 [Aspergillus eucalypticola CBS 122712]|uniref:Uncharacterized protein n=1 Tax=Aspergillus eucalypticola (strain CBS 122712 / IBT 29274) TaxID=1448314 RepID=A0A317WCC6_ASPEC|nr:uncharacterized protein BO83DRAFT_80335 [Aspergillus eucalypticola CBS 122712]PWY84114.1 hypothetical protein BO83DRAFT_80335 [Aspergillus eucalypticola CBS 122712]
MRTHCRIIPVLHLYRPTVLFSKQKPPACSDFRLESSWHHPPSTPGPVSSVPHRKYQPIRRLPHDLPNRLAFGVGRWPSTIDLPFGDDVGTSCGLFIITKADFWCRASQSSRSVVAVLSKSGDYIIPTIMYGGFQLTQLPSYFLHSCLACGTCPSIIKYSYFYRYGSRPISEAWLDIQRSPDYEAHH